MNQVKNPQPAIFDPFGDIFAKLEQVGRMIHCDHDMQSVDPLRQVCAKGCGMKTNLQDMLAHGHYECDLDVTEDTQQELGRGYAWCQDHNEAVHLTWWSPTE
jgi:hypothetical protein